jgi:hypothetical protein
MALRHSTPVADLCQGGVAVEEYQLPRVVWPGQWSTSSLR